MIITVHCFPYETGICQKNQVNTSYSLQWRHNDRDGVSNHRPHHCLLGSIFRRRSKITGLCAGNSPVTGEFSAQMASNAEIVSIWWRHRVTSQYHMMTLSNGNIFRVTDHLCGEFTGHQWIPAQRPVTRSFDVFFDLRLDESLSKQWWGWWFETTSRPLWHQCNDQKLWYWLWKKGRFSALLMKNFNYLCLLSVVYGQNDVPLHTRPSARTATQAMLYNGRKCKYVFMYFVINSAGQWSKRSHDISCIDHDVSSLRHNDDVIMTTLASQITSLTVVYSIVYSGVDERKHQRSAPLAFVRGIQRDRWTPRTKGQ